MKDDERNACTAHERNGGTLPLAGSVFLCPASNSAGSFALYYTMSLRWALSQLGIGGTQIDARRVQGRAELVFD